ncbi:hypothetical protein GALL_66590 [mine drainage metagenome]|uniref:Uncharacterized protein n=1 Tax=mine drainage metagenome TaxID=410659 RepID=A0A1J5STF6_9ZZZZ
MVAEALLALWFGWSRFGLGSDESGLYTFSFLTLLYFAALSIVSARERRWFWMTMPSKLVVAAVVAETLIGTSLMFVGLPGLAPVPWWEALAIFGYAAVSCLVVNEVVKVVLINWRRPAGIAGMPATLRMQIATRAYELYEHHGYSDGHADQDWLQAEREIRKKAPTK